MTVPQLEAHFIHYAYLFSVIVSFVYHILINVLCPHTNTHISVTETTKHIHMYCSPIPALQNGINFMALGIGLQECPVVALPGSDK